MHFLRHPFLESGYHPRVVGSAEFEKQELCATFSFPDSVRCAGISVSLVGSLTFLLGLWRSSIFMAVVGHWRYGTAIDSDHSRHTGASLYRKLKEQAAVKGHSIRELVLAGVRIVLLEVSCRVVRKSSFPLLFRRGRK